MNTKAAERILNKAGLQVVCWNGSFTVARIKTLTSVVEFDVTGGRVKLEARLKEFLKIHQTKLSEKTTST